jgi:UDP-perosamine 4-acetyltransferase
MSKGLPVLVLGGGGHACVLLDQLRNAERQVLGVLDPNAMVGTSIMENPVVGDDSYLDTLAPGKIELINGIGMLPGNLRRIECFNNLTFRGFKFASVISDEAAISASVTFEVGAQVLRGVVIQPNVFVGKNVVVNTNSSIDHGCVLESNVWISPGVTICGDVRIGENSYISAGVTILQGVSLKPQTVIPAGSVVKPNS